ncbi:lysine transporter LysE [Arenibacter sp. TNZ]|jgi:threonine/homoserine/homoserine lactone efflux protein|uniref:LysE family transporter n=1 Tax=Arenibacter TaxID=178469 RepID=UPI000CD3AD83|nr:MULTISPECIES: LysE family transporter [Arenibacter]MCM4171940.1 lysine transporter LysE [Arenibacter sp. TNZ]
MDKYVRIALIGLLISFLGSLPLGTLNITAFQIAAFQNVWNAITFSLGVVLVELVVVRLTLMGAKTFDLGNKIFLYLMPLAILLLMYLSFSSFSSIANPRDLGANTNVIPLVKSSFIWGLLLSTLNPMHIPFWMGWNSILVSKNKLNNEGGMYSFYILGIGLGSMLGLLIFIFTGKYVFQNYQQFQYIISYGMGALYLGFSTYLLFLFYKKHLKPIIT